MNIYIVLGIIFLVLFIIAIVLTIVYWEAFPPVGLFISGTYICKGTEKYWDDEVNLDPFFPNVYQPENAAFLSILSYNTSIEECKEDNFVYPKELRSYYHDIYVEKKSQPIRYARIYYVKESDTILVFLQSMKYREMMYDALKIWKIEYEGMEVHSGLWTAYQLFRDELMLVIKEHHQGKIVFFGHSTGGTFANYAAFDLVKNQKYDRNKVFVYSYGEMPPGDEKFKQSYNKLVPNTYTITNGKDSILTSLLNWGYQFVGKNIELQFESRGYYNHSLADYVKTLIKRIKKMKK